MSISQVLVILLRRGWIVLLAVLTTMIVAGGIVLFVPGRYEATATASIDPDGVDPISEEGKARTGRADAGQHPFACFQRASRGRRREAVEFDGRSAGPGELPELPLFRSRKHRGVDGLLTPAGVDPKFAMGTNVLAIKYKSADPNQAALMANAFLAATIDGSVAMKTAEADQNARWFAPQIEELHKQLEASRAALAAFQAETNMVAPDAGADSDTSQYMALSGQLSSARAQLTTLQTRLASGNTDLSNDPSDPDLQILAGLKERVSASETAIESAKGVIGSANPKMMAEQANLASMRRQIGEATEKMKQHLKQHIATAQDQITALEAEQTQAQKALIQLQGQRARLSELQHDVAFRAEQLNARERAAAEAKLKSKLTFSDMTVLDKATAPLQPSFPKPLVVIPVGIAAGIGLGLLLALLAEATDRRVRFPIDLEYAASAPFLGSLDAVRRARARVGAPRRALRPA